MQRRNEKILSLPRCCWGKFSSESLQHSGFWLGVKIWLELVLCGFRSWSTLFSDLGAGQHYSVCLDTWGVKLHCLGDVRFVCVKVRLALSCQILRAFMVTQWWRICLPVRETSVRSLGWGDPLEEEMATCSSSLAWRIPWTEEPGGVQFVGSPKCWRQLSNWTVTIRFLRILQLHFYCLNCINSFLFGVVLFGLVLNTRIKYGTGQVKIEFGLATVALICSEGHDCMKFCLHDVYLVIRCPFSFNWW